MTELTPIVVALAALLSAVYGVLHGNLAALFNLLAPILQLRAVDFSKLKADLLALTPENRALLEQAFDQALSIPDKAVLAQMVGVANILDGAVTLGEDIVKAAMQFYGRGLDLVNRFKALFALARPGYVGAVSVGRPSWIPAWIPSWILAILTDVVLPALAVALPSEAALIFDLIAYLKGNAASPRLQASFASYKASQP